ncbi:MAG: hypothetical protein N3D73_00275 [Candidatus Diapherotrites archaeon]|nr:hypothetical protein [Candidatus Diapherotrites archaeon]
MTKIFLKILQESGKEREFDLFLKIFKKIPRYKFAIIVVDDEIIEKYVNVLSKEIKFLTRMNIFPTILLTKRWKLKKEDYHKKKKSLVDVKEALTKYFMKYQIKFDEMNFAIKNGKTRISLFKIKKIVKAKRIPVVIGNIKEKGKIRTIEKTKAWQLLASTLRPTKIIILDEDGFVKDAKRKNLYFININTLDTKNISDKHIDFIRKSRKFLRKNPKIALIVTSPDKIIKEIFTIKGRGTFIKYHEIRYAKRLGKEKKEKLRKLIERAFRRKLKKDYFKEKIIEVVYQKDFEGAAIIKKIGNFYYLDKFVVDVPYQGTGLGKSLWETIIRKYHKIMWRARKNNKINSFYIKECDGLIKKNNWIIYWKNIREEEAIKNISNIYIKKTDFK